jgi:hypothetical protein
VLILGGGTAAITVAAAQDYMCEPFMLEKTGLSVAEHQRLTVERYDVLVVALAVLFPDGVPFQIMPVLQGFAISDYLRHIEMYGDRLTPGMWVGVGSVCKRQGNAAVIEDLLLAIKGVRPDLRLHGFRREVDLPAKPYRPQAAVQRRQHGVVFRRQKSRAGFKRLARSQGIRVARPHPIKRAGTAPTVRRMMDQPA